MNNYKPPFHLTDVMTSLVAEISEQLGRIAVLQEGKMNSHLRRENRIRTIHSSLAIEHNFLSLEQVTAILDGKRILGNPNEIKEVQNAYEAYELIHSIKELTVIGRPSGQVSDQVNDQVSDQVDDQDGTSSDQVDDQDGTPMDRLLAALGNETLSALELMKRLGLSHRQSFRKHYLNPALEHNLIQRTIPDKPKSKNQKYKRRKSS